MTPVQLACYAFLTGLTICGLAGTVMEIVAGRRLSFAEPFVSSERALRSLASAAAAGPFMLASDALDAWRRGDVSAVVALSCAITAAIWALATGIVALDLAARAVALSP